nr:hypothetical protein [Tanacetum cinerariifolium]
MMDLRVKDSVKEHSMKIQLIVVRRRRKAFTFHPMETEEVSERYIALCFVDGLHTYDGEINLEFEKNMISNEFAVKLCLDYEEKEGEKVMKKDFLVALKYGEKCMKQKRPRENYKMIHDGEGPFLTVNRVLTREENFPIASFLAHKHDSVSEVDSMFEEEFIGPSMMEEDGGNKIDPVVLSPRSSGTQKVYGFASPCKKGSNLNGERLDANTHNNEHENVISPRFNDVDSPHPQFIKRHEDNVTWQQYEEGIKERFDLVNEYPMVELKNLKQLGLVQAYQDLFEALLNKVEQPKAYAISLFIRGLKDKIGLVMRMFKPIKLSDAYCLAKMQEATLAIPKSRYTSLLSTPKSVIVPKSGDYGVKNNTLALPPVTLVVRTNRPRKQLTQQEMADKRAKHQCFYYDQRCTPGHKCSGQMYNLEVIGCDEIIEEGDCTMKVKGHVKKQLVHMLIDCGSTHSFLDVQATKRLGCKMSKICPLQVSLANGQVMSSVFECKCLKWSLQGHIFETNVVILPLEGCEMVLGIQWLETSGTIQCDLKNLVMDFVVNGKRCVLRGTPQSSLQWMQGKQIGNSLSQMGMEISSMALCVCSTTLIQMTGSNAQSDSQIQTLLKEFETLFETPKELPLNRSHDHTIPLLPNTPPINVRPYRHPPNKKQTIKLMVNELLEVGTIQCDLKNLVMDFVVNGKSVYSREPHSLLCNGCRMTGSNAQSDSQIQTLLKEFETLFETPKELPLNRSHDHTIPLLPNTPPINVRPYRHPPNKKQTIKLMVNELLEVDYKILNKYTIKDKFPIPIMKELLDELNGAKSLMYVVFKPHLRKFALVFFDDILVYSKSDKEHWKHLKTVLQTMKEHTLFAKQSKCTLAATQVEYLRHLITAEGVSTDPTKTFIVETDASGVGIGAVLQQEGSEDVVADAFSRLTNGSELNALGTNGSSKYVWEGGVLKGKGKLVVGANESLRTTIVKHYHVDAIGIVSFWATLVIIVQIAEGGTKNVNCILSSNRWANRSGKQVLGMLFEVEMAVEMVDRSLQARKRAIDMLEFHIKRAHDMMKKYADLKRSERELDMGMGNSLRMGALPQCGEGGLLAIEPELILDIRIGQGSSEEGWIVMRWKNSVKFERSTQKVKLLL